MSRPTTLTAHTLPVSWSPVSFLAGHCVSLQFTSRTLWVCVCRNGCQLGQMWFRRRRPSTRTLQEPWRPCPSWACPSCWSAWAARALKRSVLSSPLLIAHATWAGAECTQLPELQFGLPLATAACYCCMLLLHAAAACYCCLLLLLATAACCCCLLLLRATTACYCCLLLLLATAACYCCMLLLLATAACYCCLLLLLATAACYCCLLLLLATAACYCCCYLLLLLATAACYCCCLLLRLSFLAMVCLHGQASLELIGCVCLGRPPRNSHIHAVSPSPTGLSWC